MAVFSQHKSPSSFFRSRKNGFRRRLCCRCRTYPGRTRCQLHGPLPQSADILLDLITREPFMLAIGRLFAQAIQGEVGEVLTVFAQIAVHHSLPTLYSDGRLFGLSLRYRCFLASLRRTPRLMQSARDSVRQRSAYIYVATPGIFSNMFGYVNKIPAKCIYSTIS